MTTSIGSATSYTLTVPSLTETADIQVALKLLSYGTSSDPADNAGISSNSIIGYVKSAADAKADKTIAPVTVTATTHTIASTTNFLIFNTTATCTVTLPTPANNSGRVLFVKNIAAFAINSASSNVRPLSTNVLGTIILTNTAGKWAQLVCDGSSWIVMSAN
jgi:hypothetical protein